MDGTGKRHARFTWSSTRKQGAYPYLLNIVSSVNWDGKAACIVRHGVLFRGNAEAEKGYDVR